MLSSLISRRYLPSYYRISGPDGMGGKEKEREGKFIRSSRWVPSLVGPGRVRIGVWFRSRRRYIGERPVRSSSYPPHMHHAHTSWHVYIYKECVDCPNLHLIDLLHSGLFIFASPTCLPTCLTASSFAYVRTVIFHVHGQLGFRLSLRRAYKKRSGE